MRCKETAELQLSCTNVVCVWTDVVPRGDELKNIICPLCSHRAYYGMCALHSSVFSNEEPFQDNVQCNLQKLGHVETVETTYLVQKQYKMSASTSG